MKSESTDEIMVNHIGLPLSHFNWVFNEVEDVTKKMRYWDCKGNTVPKAYEVNTNKKPGPDRKLGPRDELLLVLIRL